MTSTISEIEHFQNQNDITDYNNILLSLIATQRPELNKNINCFHHKQFIKYEEELILKRNAYLKLPSNVVLMLVAFNCPGGRYYDVEIIEKSKMFEWLGNGLLAQNSVLMYGHLPMEFLQLARNNLVDDTEHMNINYIPTADNNKEYEYMEIFEKILLHLNNI